MSRYLISRTQDRTSRGAGDWVHVRFPPNPSFIIDTQLIVSKSYRFGKGVYFADASSKSLGYTHYHTSLNTGLLLLCEVVTKPLLELSNADYDANLKCQNANAM